MHIVIDYTPAVHQRAGIGRYTRGLVNGLMQLNPPHRFTLLVLGRSGAYYIPDRLPNSFTLRVVPLSDRWATVIWHRMNLPLPVELLAGRADLFHGPSFTLPPALMPCVLTVHDLSFLRYPQGAHPPLLRWLRRAVPRSVRRARHILADSDNTRKDLIELMHVPPERITVIGAGIEEHFRRVEDRTYLEAVRERYQLPEHFILGVSTLEPRKNFTGLIAAFNILAARPEHTQLDLVIAGGKGWNYEPIFAAAEGSPFCDRIHFIGFVEDKDLPALYSLASAFVFPSHYEGFGIPVLEAMACGTPVVCANNSSLPEIVGDAALMVDSVNPLEIAEALGRVLTDATLRQEIVQRGYVQSRRFTWQAAAQRLLEVYETLATEGI
ncbi:MAG: glycosyltransferase family 4 protein [Anaerolineae bacterium]